MPKFFYIARNKIGQKVTGAEEAAGQEEVINRLQAKGLLVIDVISESKDNRGFRPEVASGRGGPFRFKHYRVSSDDLTLFCRQLATLLSAGVTIIKSLDVISRQIASRKLFTVIRSLQKNMEEGLSLHESMAKYPLVFSELWVNLVESGEASGNLAMILNRLATYLERNAAFRRSIVSALIYPIILLVAALSALLFLSMKIIPTFAEIFKGFNIELPLLTRLLIAFSAFLRHYLVVIVAAIAVIFYLTRRYIRTRAGRLRLEGFLFALPMFGEFFRAMAVERFSSEMSTLTESGVPILYSLEIVEHSVGNLVLGNIIRRIKDSIREGKSLSQPLEESGFFDPMVVQMITIGEEIGELPPMFKKINAFYQEYSQTFLDRFVTMFEPIMLVFLGIIIGTLVIGMFLPIFDIAKLGNTQ